MGIFPAMLLRWFRRKVVHPSNGFSAATVGEPFVFGARRPGFPLQRVGPEVVGEWLCWMKVQNVQRVVCLLPEGQLRYYDDLLGAYQVAFGLGNVCWAPIKDFHLADLPTLTNTILPFLEEATQQGERVVVHCSGGIGRTGHVLAAWLVRHYRMSNSQAIEAVKRTGRNPREGRDKGLDALLDACRHPSGGS